MTKPASTALAHLQQQRAQLHEEIGMPAGWLPRWWQARGLRAVGQRALRPEAFAQLSPDSSRLSLVTQHPIGTLGGTLQIDIYDAFCLELVSSFTLACGSWTSVVEHRHFTCVTDLMWLDDAHLAFGFHDGWLRVYDLQGALCSQACIGDNVVGMARGGGQLAITLFPYRAVTVEPDLRTLGIKFFAIEELLAGRFEPELFLPHRDRTGLPHTIRRDPGGQVLWALGGDIGSAGKSYSGWAERIELPHGRGTPYVTTPDRPRRHAISEIGEDGEVVVCADAQAMLIDRHGETLAQLTTCLHDQRRVRRLGPGRHLLAARGLWLLDFRAKQVRVVGPDLGRLVDVWPLPDGSVIAITHSTNTCELARFDPDSHAVLARSARGPVRHIDAYAFAYDHAAQLNVGDYRGRLHRFDDKLDSLPSLDLDAGPLQFLISDPTRQRVGVVSASGATHWVLGDSITPAIHFDGRQIDPGDDLQSIDITPADEVFLSAMCAGYRAWIDRDLYFRFDRSGSVWCWRRRSGAPNSSRLPFEITTEFKLPPDRHPQGCTVLNGHPVAVCADGSLLVFEPEPPSCGARNAEGALPELWPDGAREVASGFADPIGVAAIGTHALVIWSRDHLYRVQLDDALTRVVAQRSVESAHVGAVRIDPRTGGLVSSHESHLAFWGPELDERYRLALLEDGSALWHVLQPGDRTHPGWLWREAGFEPWITSLFEMRDTSDRTVTDPALREAFVAARFSQSRVKLALADYGAFARDLSGARVTCLGREGTRLQVPLLLPSPADPAL